MKRVAVVALMVMLLLAGHPKPVRVAGAEPEVSDRAFNELVLTVRNIEAELRRSRSFSELEAIRSAQKDFLRSNAKFPDYLDVGVDVWLNVYDWHVRWQQPLTVGRDVAGRYTLAMLGTTVVMRTDTAPTYVGLPYDNR